MTLFCGAAGGVGAPREESSYGESLPAAARSAATRQQGGCQSSQHAVSLSRQQLCTGSSLQHNQAAPAAATPPESRQRAEQRRALGASTHLQVERDVERVPEGDEGQGHDRGGGLGTHNFGDSAAGRQRCSGGGWSRAVNAGGSGEGSGRPTAAAAAAIRHGRPFVWQQWA